MMQDRNDSDVDEGSVERLDDAAAEEEDDEEDESDQDEYSSDDDSGVENVDSDYNADDVSEDGSLGAPPLEEKIQFMLTLSKGHYDDQIGDALEVDYVHKITTHHSDIDRYNKPTNWMERNAVGLENLKERLQHYNLRFAEGRQSFKLKLVHNYESRIEEAVVWHDPSIDPYWEQLTTAFSNPENGNIRIGSFRIENVEMRKETVAALVTSICGGSAINSIRDVSFINTNLCGDGIVSLSILVEQSLGLQSLTVSNNRIHDMNSARCLSRALKLHPRINFLDLSHCDLGNDPDILTVILQSDVNHIVLCISDIDSLGAVKISEYLEGNPPIGFLYLDHNGFNDDDAILLSRALKRNTNLRQIFLRSNNFTSVGVKALFTGVFDGSSLNAISESNHTCELRLFHDHPPIQQLLSRKDPEAVLSSLNETFDRTSKILIALHDKESLLEYLADLPVELMPEVLAFIQKERDQIHSMSMMYVAMRWWNMPSLYSFHHCVSSNTKRKRDAQKERDGCVDVF